MLIAVLQPYYLQIQIVETTPDVNKVHHICITKST